MIRRIGPTHTGPGRVVPIRGPITSAPVSDTPTVSDVVPERITDEDSGMAAEAVAEEPRTESVVAELEDFLL